MTSPAVAPTENDHRHVGFKNIDFEGNMRAVLGHPFRHIDDPAGSNALRERFKERPAEAERGGNVRADKPPLLHSRVYYMVDLFEEGEDEAALAALRKLEVECF